ncbi:inhibin beta B chain-like [Centruroides sculpturatus]|uniref:inhibin beta B chain-like n=1 Tax=Centruroides sculpturatus TaxID=218467 RepID=UPI000C6D151E|nr:inhibin beta B chain-like [Centruroides sculpturatus]
MTRQQPGAQRQAVTAVVLLCAALLQAAVLPVDTGHGLTDTLLINTCPHCITVGDRQLANRLKVEAIKQQILSKLSLREKPNITAPVSREVALEALRRIGLQSMLPPEHSILRDDADVNGGNLGRDDYYGRTSEIIAFAEPGSSLNGHVLLDFYHPHEHVHRLRVTAATLWIQLRYSSSSQTRRSRQTLREPPVTLYVFRVPVTNVSSAANPDGSLPYKMLTSHKVTHAGWRRIDMGDAVQRWFSSSNHEKLTLLVDCGGCERRLELVLFNETLLSNNSTFKHIPKRLRHSGGHNLRPFLAITTEMIRQRRARRHAVTCDSQTTQCCKQTLYVNFRELGWADWIIAPKGYYANYCMGDCASTRRPPDTFVSFHTHILEEYRNRNPYASITPCCAPTKLSPMSLIYFDPDMNIIKTDLPKMIVDECGCT